MKKTLSILLLLPTLLIGQIAIGVGVGVPYGNVKPNVAPFIVSSPVNDTVNGGSNGDFTVTATGTKLTYQWQYSKTNTTFTNLTNTGVYSGVTTTKLVLTNVSYLNHRGYFRCIVSGNKRPPDTTTSAMIYVWDTDANAYFARFTTAPTLAFKLKVNTFVVGQKDSGLWAKKAVIGYLETATAQAAVLNMKGNYNNATFVNTPTFTANDGVTADAGYVNSNFNPTTHGGTIYVQNSAGILVYIKSNVAKTGTNDIVSNSVTAPYLGLNSRQATTNNTVVVINHGGVAISANNTVLNSIGIWSSQRTGATLTTLKRNNITLITDVTASTGRPNANLIVGTNYNNTEISTRKYGYYEISSGLTPTEETANYNQIKTLTGYTP